MTQAWGRARLPALGAARQAAPQPWLCRRSWRWPHLWRCGVASVSTLFRGRCVRAVAAFTHRSRPRGLPELGPARLLPLPLPLACLRALRLASPLRCLFPSPSRRSLLLLRIRACCGLSRLAAAGRGAPPRPASLLRPPLVPAVPATRVTALTPLPVASFVASPLRPRRRRPLRLPPYAPAPLTPLTLHSPLAAPRLVLGCSAVVPSRRLYLRRLHPPLLLSLPLLPAPRLTAPLVAPPLLRSLVPPPLPARALPLRLILPIPVARLLPLPSPASLAPLHLPPPAIPCPLATPPACTLVLVAPRWLRPCWRRRRRRRRRRRGAPVGRAVGCAVRCAGTGMFGSRGFRCGCGVGSIGGLRRLQ